MNDTIFALATAQGKAGIAVVRLSGPEAVSALTGFVGALPVPGRGLRKVRDRDGGLIDQALVLTFAEGASFTGEAVVELHLHGSPAIVSAVLDYLGGVAGLRQAEPGEFTKRALENGRLDLAQVEGLADLIDAETEAQRQQAVRVFAGALGEMAEAWRAKLIRAAALIEATIDFADEEVPVDVTPEVLDLVGLVSKEMQREISGVAAAERIRNGFEVAIIGAPNVGKSTLLNRLAGRSAAITSEVAGTTRDVIEVQMEIAGLPVTLLDTAGLRASDDVVETIGIERGRERAAQADMRIHLLEDADDIEEFDDALRVLAKADARATTDGMAVSGLTGAGLDQLIGEIGRQLKQKSAPAGLAIRARHRDALIRGVEGLERVQEGFSPGVQSADLIAEELRYVLRAVDSLVGRVDVEDILGEIFSSFCIGK